MTAHESSEPQPQGLTDPAFWDAQWDDRAGRRGMQELLHSRDFGKGGSFLRVMDRHVGLSHFKNARVVELGGAASRFLVDLAINAGANVTAVDYSDTGVRQTERLFRERGVNGAAIAADMFTWQSPDPFDFVLHWGLLEHFDEPQAVLRVTADLLKRGGKAVFSMPNLEARGARLWQRNSPDNFSKHILHTDEAIRSACDAVGLRLDRAFHFGLPLVRMAPPEAAGLVSRAADVVHAACCAANTIAPQLFVSGHRAISNTRGFVATRI